MPIPWRNKLLLAKLEATYNVNPVPVGADAVLAREVSLTPMEGNDVSRELDLPWFAAQATLPGELRARLTFQVELAPSGTPGVVPAWDPMIRACGCAVVIIEDTSVTYTPVSDNFASLTLNFWVGTTLWRLHGARGTCVIRINAQGIPRLEFDFTGLFSVPSETARLVANLSDYQDPQIATSANTPTFTIDGDPMVLRNFALNFGNQVEGRFLIGSEGILITDRADAVEATVEAVPLTTFNPYQVALEAQRLPIVLRHGTGAGRISTLTIPAAQMQRPGGLENNQNIVEWPLRFVPLPTAGDDQWSLTLT